MLNFLNSGLQTIATALVVFGADEVLRANYIGGGILIVTGFIAYLVYEFTPSKDNNLTL